MNLQIVISDNHEAKLINDHEDEHKRVCNEMKILEHKIEIRKLAMKRKHYYSQNKVI